jgi:hypothetical protein
MTYLTSDGSSFSTFRLGVGDFDGVRLSCLPSSSDDVKLIDESGDSFFSAFRSFSVFEHKNYMIKKVHATKKTLFLPQHLKISGIYYLLKLKTDVGSVLIAKNIF